MLEVYAASKHYQFISDSFSAPHKEFLPNRWSIMKFSAEKFKRSPYLRENSDEKGQFEKIDNLRQSAKNNEVLGNKSALVVFRLLLASGGLKMKQVSFFNRPL